MAKKSKATSKSRVALSNAVDRQLARYREMRDFSITAEPSGKNRAKPPKSKSPGLPFVIQKHAASHLHYDFRLGWNGVLKSWAVTKGPSYVVADKRLAVQVEDHPMEYGGFEGIIPRGQYGGGTVMVWDEGTWEPQAISSDVDGALRAGSLKFILHGQKLQGKWALIRMGGKAANERKPNWLLIKEHDEFERSSDDPPIVEEEPNSAVTGRDLDEIAHSQDHVWNSKDTAKGKAWYRNDKPTADREPPATKRAAPAKLSHSPRLKDALSKAPKEVLPAFVSPELAQPADAPPKAAGWVHELKLDGYRIQVRKDGAKIRLLTRTGLDWTHRMRSIAQQLKDLPAENAVIDGEVVVLDENGLSNFAGLQAAFQEGARKPLTYFAFDLLHLDGHNLRGLPLVDRKALLENLLKGLDGDIRYSQHIQADGEVVFRKAGELGAEGIISKRVASPYVSGRGGDWLKLKCVHEQEFVIGGFTEPSNGSHGVGALLLGYYDAGKLVYAGRTGTGFTQKTHKLLRDQLEKLQQPATPFQNPPAEARKGAIWVKPQLVAQVNFANWTADNVVRHAAFKGLREDKAAREVGREAAEEATEEATVPGKQRTTKRVPALSPAKAAAQATRAPKPEKPTLGHAPIRLTHPDKILDTESHLTKQQLADYYWTVAPYMLPYVADRPLSLVRCPEGTGKPCFFQKHANHAVPAGVKSVDVPDKKTRKMEAYITLSTAEALAGLAQMGALEVHPWGSKNDDLERPDTIIFDLDPDEAITWRTLADSAADVREQLASLGLKSFLKTTGGKGLHVVVPIEAKQDWSAIKQFAHDFTLAMEQQRPNRYISKMSKAARKGRIFIDYLRNERGSTAVAPYSPRARSGAPVALPLSWSDLKLPKHPIFHVADFEGWKNRLKNSPWKDMQKTRQRLGR